MKTKVLLDMDGVIADFNKAVHKAHGRENCYLQKENLGIFDIEKIWGITAEEFWKPANTKEFWLDIEMMPEADGIVRLLEFYYGVENIAVLTSPSQLGDCITAKREWLERYYPQLSKNIIFTSAKEFLAGPNRILFDDRDKNIDKFVEAGGYGITVPRLWNRKYNFSNKVVEELEFCIKDKKRYIDTYERD